MKVLKPEYIDKTVIIMQISRGKVDPDRILKELRSTCIITLVDSRAIFCDDQIINAVYYLLELEEHQKWIKNVGLRLLALLVCERQIKDALVRGNPEAEKLLLIGICNKDVSQEIARKLRKMGVTILPTVTYGSEEEVADKLGLKVYDNLCSVILEKQAELRIEIEKET